MKNTQFQIVETNLSNYASACIAIQNLIDRFHFEKLNLSLYIVLNITLVQDSNLFIHLSYTNSSCHAIFWGKDRISADCFSTTISIKKFRYARAITCYYLNKIKENRPLPSIIDSQETKNIVVTEITIHPYHNA